MLIHKDYRLWILDVRKKPNIHHLISIIFKVKLGFTLIELLIAITIISILTSVGTISYNNALDKGRDNKRKQDLAQIKGAAALYYEEKGFYPPNPAVSGGTAFASDSGDNWIPGLTPTYIQKLPKDPKQAKIPIFYALKTPQQQPLGTIYLVITNTQELSDSYALDIELQDNLGKTLDRDRFRWAKAKSEDQEVNQFTYSTIVETASRFFLKRQGFTWKPANFKLLSGGDDTILPLSSRMSSMTGAKLEVELPNVYGRLTSLTPSGGDIVTLSPEGIVFSTTLTGCALLAGSSIFDFGRYANGNAGRAAVKFSLKKIPPGVTITDVDFKVNVPLIIEGSGTNADILAYNGNGQTDPTTDSCPNIFGRMANATPYVDNDTTNFKSTGVKTIPLSAAASADIQAANNTVGDFFSLAINEDDVAPGNRTRVSSPQLIITYTTTPPTPTPTPSPSPPPVATLTPSPTPPPSTGCTGKQNVYCYIVLSNRSSFTIWAKLENSNDPEIRSKPSATCTDPPPDNNYNYCLRPD